MISNTKLDHLLRVDTPKDYRVSYKYHILFWVIYFLFNTLRWSSIHNDFSYSLKTNLIGFPIHMALAYFNVYYLMPRYIYTRKYVLYVVYIIAALVLMLLVKYNLTYYLVSPVVMPEIAPEINHLTFDYAIQTMLGEFYVISFVTAIKITVDRLRENSKLHDLEKRQLTTELRFLRSQVSPHFFFNTLNNIYSLTLEKSDKAPEVVLKLSELMRYLLYGTKKRKQNLRKEIECIQNYIDLERIRFNDSLKVSFKIEGDLDGHTIAPMLLIPIVENCFKHGASKNINKTQINIDLKIVEDFMYFSAVNTIPKKGHKNKKISKEGGIGLSNIKKRLELGYGKNDYKLSIFEKDGMFNVGLKLRV